MGWTTKPSEFKFTAISDAEKLTKKIASDTLQEVITRSPVDTGAYRANHRVSIDMQDRSSNANDVSVSATLSAGMAQIVTLRLGNTLYVQNNISYGIDLENGSSQQAPLGVYKLAFLSITNRYRGKT